METPSVLEFKTLRSELKEKPPKVDHCDCVKNKVLFRISDLNNPSKSWIKDMTMKCGHKDQRTCDCNLQITIPYGYFCSVAPYLVFGDTIGPKSMFVRIISNDGFRFIIKRKWVKHCLLIDSWFKNENQTPPGCEAEILMKKYPSICIHYLCIFLMYKNDYETGSSLPSMNFTVPDQLVFAMLELAHDLIV